MWIQAAALTGLVLIASCSGDSSSADDENVATPARYALLRDEEWTIQEAFDPAPDDPLASSQRPPIDWYVEYVRSPAALETEMVAVNGLATGFAESVSQLSGLTFDLADVPVDGWQAVGGTSEDAAGPAILVLEHGDRAITVLSYELALGELASVAALIEPADLAAWTNAGGEIG